MCRTRVAMAVTMPAPDSRGPSISRVHRGYIAPPNRPSDRSSIRPSVLASAGTPTAPRAATGWRLGRSPGTDATARQAARWARNAVQAAAGAHPSHHTYREVITRPWRAWMARRREGTRGGRDGRSASGRARAEAVRRRPAGPRDDAGGRARGRRGVADGRRAGARAAQWPNPSVRTPLPSLTVHCLFDSMLSIALATTQARNRRPEEQP
ncbi:DUF7848 domain-containing protein [Streptomyces sp. H27-D2]|uniref:DUF7848 domain-containing protein n=1 Tax=Streptomyces sp. H27-D2 TaxID=3046304 RepID=UPI003FA6EE66